MSYNPNAGASTFTTLVVDGSDTISVIDDTTVPFAIGNKVTSGAFMGMDPRAIQTQSAGSGVSFAINPHGGDVNLGPSSSGTGNINFYGTRNQFVQGNIYLSEVAAAGTDVGGDGQLWVRNDTPNVLMFTDDAGTDFTVNVTAV